MNIKLELSDDVSFTTVEEFKSLLSALRRKVSRGELRECKVDSPFVTEKSILDVDVDGPWPDYIEWYFESAGSLKRYKFSANTYRGSGGKWQAIN
jgi:hypothetical protein